MIVANLMLFENEASESSIRHFDCGMQMRSKIEFDVAVEDFSQ